MKLFLAAFALIALFFGCSSSKDIGQGSTPVDKELELVVHLTENMMAPRLADWSVGAQNLSGEVRSACSGESQPLSVMDLQNQWQSLMNDYHYTQPFIFGPLLIEEEDKKGDTNPIQDVLYSLQDPRSQGRVIDAEIKKSNINPQIYSLRNTPNLIGLDALEYLLFVRLSGQESLGVDDETCVYFNALNSHLVEWVEKVNSSFQKLVYLPLHTAAGKTETTYYIDAYTKGLLHFADKVLKDRKMAAPLGIKTSDNFNCQQGVDCHLIFIEHSYSKTPRLAMLTSLQAIEDAFQGTVWGEAKGFGFSDYISDNSGQLKSFSENLFVKRWKSMPSGDDYVQAFANYQGDQDLNNPAYAAFAEIKQLTDWLKTDFVADMNAELPKNVQGDTD